MSTHEGISSQARIEIRSDLRKHRLSLDAAAVMGGPLAAAAFDNTQAEPLEYLTARERADGGSGCGEGGAATKSLANIGGNPICTGLLTCPRLQHDKPSFANARAAMTFRNHDFKEKITILLYNISAI